MRSTRLWAVERADFRNANRMYGDVEAPWSVEDVLDPTQRMNEKVKRQMEFVKMHARMGAITKDTPGDAPGLPSWAARKWDPKDYPDLFGGQSVV